MNCAPIFDRLLLYYLDFAIGFVAITAVTVSITIAVVDAGFVGGIDDGEVAQPGRFAMIAGNGGEGGSGCSFSNVERDIR